MAQTSKRWPRHRPPLHWKIGVSARKRWRSLRRLWRADRDVERCRYFGADFDVVHTDIIGGEIMLGRYEWLQIPRMIEACRLLKPAAFIDVGANFGVYTCIIAKQRLAGRVIAFEPNRSAFERLRAHIVLNGLTRVEIHPFAAGAAHGSGKLLPAAISGLSAMVESHPDAYSVQVVSLDELLSLSGQAIALKIDVEGYELAVIEGARKLLSENYGYAQIETLDEEDDSVIEAMARLGWQLRDRVNTDFLFERQRR